MLTIKRVFGLLACIHADQNLTRSSSCHSNAAAATIRTANTSLSIIAVQFR